MPRFDEGLALEYFHRLGKTSDGLWVFMSWTDNAETVGRFLRLSRRAYRLWPASEREKLYTPPSPPPLAPVDNYAAEQQRLKKAGVTYRMTVVKPDGSMGPPYHDPCEAVADVYKQQLPDGSQVVGVWRIHPAEPAVLLCVYDYDSKEWVAP